MHTLHITKKLFLFSMVTSQFGCSNGTQQVNRLPNPNPTAPTSSSLEETEKRLRAHVSYLSETIGVRNIAYFEKLNEAAKYIEEAFREAGYSSTNLTIIPYTAKYTGEAFKNEYDTNKIIKGNPYKMTIIEAIVNSNPDVNTNNECVVIGAHYDTVDGSPGADDNASGVAGVLEIAKHMLKYEGKIEKTLKFVLFPNEEEPYSLDSKAVDRKATAAKYGVDTMGSRVYAKMAREKGEHMEVVVLESIGYFSNEPGSQKFPSICRISLAPLFKLLGYPDIGNEAVFVSKRGASKEFADRCMSASKNAKVAFPINYFSAPHWFPILGRLVERSDHASFWREGFDKAIMISDTADSRNKNYHKNTDTIADGSVNFKEFTKLVENLKEITEGLVSSTTAEKPETEIESPTTSTSTSTIAQ
ncbi:M28 family peptidase [Candidatus Cardinium hertigii]|uniref:M20/M25/M40 family metallo-hydrolase n=1 Tax=Candidatus Cardinium hertigii TaxID=247481 RepID=A0A3N2QB93_9BACT|nr:M28 family peptidase [Candidatus Cardinium hertigii]ROT47077.1 M20/M25/M40 family metallo-hydrolase [Candidatus Cardinium hertigii]